MLSKLLLTGLTALSLTACTTLSPQPPQTIKLLPPVELLQDCPVPQLIGRTNRFLAEGYEARGAALEACNADKAALREWANGS